MSHSILLWFSNWWSTLTPRCVYISLYYDFNSEYISLLFQGNIDSYQTQFLLIGNAWVVIGNEYIQGNCYYLGMIYDIAYIYNNYVKNFLSCNRNISKSKNFFGISLEWKWWNLVLIAFDVLWITDVVTQIAVPVLVIICIKLSYTNAQVI